jgi:hypothetical protein
MLVPDSAPWAALTDKQAIYEVILRYCRGIDRLDMDLVHSCYHLGAIDHHTNFEGDRDAFVIWVEAALRRLAGTMHLVGNHLVELDGDAARVETYCTAFHWADPSTSDLPNMTTGLRYVDRFERRFGEWRIAERFALREWIRMEPDQRGADPAEGPTGRRDHSDPVFRPLR